MEPTEQEQAGYEFEAGRQRLLDQRREWNRAFWMVMLLLFAAWLWFAHLSPTAKRDARDRQEFKARIDAMQLP